MCEASAIGTLSHPLVLQDQTATVRTVVGLGWASFDRNVSLFGKLDSSACLPGDQ